ncbi:MAG TPA: caspase family protein [Pyrinomonadaceae bacterium]|nr:caspase family protein [Pyrinomonadaceae bacterium]
MDKFLVHEEPVAGAATHAIVIGIGDYPHLLGGSDTLSNYNDGMGQLTSPPVSARKFAEWLIQNYENPNQPLASVSLLLSEAPAKDFTNPKSQQIHQPEEATYANAEEAISAWAVRGRQNKENLLIFYFCGHGIAQGSDMSLLMSDYGRNALAPLKQAIDFRRFRLGMARNLPSRQIYFVDACRANSDQLIENFGYAGDPMISVGVEDVAEAPVYFATLSGELAFGKPNEVSVFTDGLIKGLNGSGSDDSEGDWRVTTSRLKEAIDYHVRQALESGAKRAQVPPTDDLTTFEIHHLRGLPEVPVSVTCKPPSENQNAEFVCEGGALRNRRQPDSAHWTLPLPAGKYRFAAEFPLANRTSIQQEVHVRPIYRKVTLEVK